MTSNIEINALDEVINKNIGFVESKEILFLNVYKRQRKEDVQPTSSQLKKRRRVTFASQAPGIEQTPVPCVIFKLGQNKYGRKTVNKELKFTLIDKIKIRLIITR